MTSTFKPSLWGRSAVNDRPAEKLIIISTNRMMPDNVTALMTTFRRRRSSSGGGSKAGVASSEEWLVLFLNESSTAIITSTKTIEHTIKNHHQSRLRLSACGPAGLIAFWIPPHDERHSATTGAKRRPNARNVVLVLLVIEAAG